MQTAKTPFVIIATCMIAGPAIGVLILFVEILLVFLYAAATFAISGTPHAGGGITLLLIGTMLVSLPLFAAIGILVVAPQTFLTGVALAIVHILLQATNLHVALSGRFFGLLRFLLAFFVALLVALAYAPHSAPRALMNLGPFSVQFAAALAGAICNHLALLGVPAVNQSFDPDVTRGPI